MGLSDMDKLKDKEKVAVLQQRIQFQNETIENQKRQISELKEELTQVKGQTETFTTTVHNQTGVIADQQRTLKDQESTILEQQKSISNFQQQLVELQKKVEKSTIQVSEADGKYRDQIEQLKTDLAAVNKMMDEKTAEFNKKIVEREDTIKDLRNKVVSLEKKEKDFKELKEKITPDDSTSLEKRILDMEAVLQEADATISSLEQQLQKNKQITETELKVRDIKIAEYEELIRKQGIAKPALTDTVSDQDTAAEAIIQIFSRTKSNVMIFLPDPRVLSKIDFASLRSIIRVHLAVPDQKDNTGIIEKLKVKSNIEIRNFTDANLWGIIRDNEELLLAPINEKGLPQGLIMKGDVQIETFGTVMRSTWSRLRHI